MQQWEYLIVSCSTIKGVWHVTYANGKEIKDLGANDDIASYCNKVGSEGWELLHVAIATIFAPGPNGFFDIGMHRYETKETSYRLFFKRPK